MRLVASREAGAGMNRRLALMVAVAAITVVALLAPAMGQGKRAVQAQPPGMLRERVQLHRGPIGKPFSSRPVGAVDVWCGQAATAEAWSRPYLVLNLDRLLAPADHTCQVTLTVQPPEAPRAPERTTHTFTFTVLPGAERPRPDR